MAQYVESPTLKSEISWLDAEVEVSRATYEAYQMMYYAFIALPAIAGLDKFLHVLTTWDNYVSPGIASFLHLTPAGVTSLAGLVEIAIAITVALKPRIGSWVVTAWLWLVVINLLTLHNYYDIVLGDLALSAAGVAFTRLSAECN
jgi:hypothetical protein